MWSESSDHPVSTRSAGKKPEGWVVIGLCRDNRDRQYRPRVIQLNSKASDKAREDQGRFSNRELRPDADPWPHPERQVGISIDRRCSRHKPIWDESVRLNPSPPMAVEQPW
jgi:hypothetical protein